MATGEATVTTNRSARQGGYVERARFYEVEYRTTVDQEFLKGLVTDKVQSVLEIPCGAGRNLDWLLATGRQVLCADLEPAMVQRVGERIAAAGATDRATAAQADLRKLDFGRRFDLILVPQEAFQLVEAPGDAEQALSALARQLAPGGTLLLDLHTFAADKHDRRDKQDRHHQNPALPDYFDPAIEDGTLFHEWRRTLQGPRWLERSRRQHDEGGARTRIDYHYRLGEDERVLDRWESWIRLRRYTREEIAGLAGQAGLRIAGMARDYSGTPWTPGAARMITLLRSATGQEDS
ncbi:class I SAM-dependent methyltransferase [Streptomyces sioyaensis]|uniref:Class I SAM-dependent methyltransferase n=1 Tax=Streptomyces sioyaensis TaxID=67364 RepID=A0A4Q1QSN2_9ACTN|nr:class I SAM-dependent methyltransferase [Streptomyces sioyaensis]MBM4792849.1 class I SAM-dependent methyltransferase [Streptomyces sioyaensis]RXS65135.1 class I SAM-dependent methyltransferase [Streptomyces sioyaensis]